MGIVEVVLLLLSSDLESFRSRRLNIPPKKPGCAALTGPFAAVTVLPIPPDAKNNGVIPLFMAFSTPWFGWGCGCYEI